MRSETDERLKYHLNTNQSERERLVIDLLPQLGSYANCRPRRPQGGPDRGVDIVAELLQEGPVLVSVGFKNDAGPPKVDRSWVRRKFMDDLARAKASGINAIGFVFVTNVDLTPATKRDLKQTAVGEGFVHSELYDREQLRLALDRPEGFFLRLRYLDIPMTIEEQYRLLATVGTELGHLATTIQSIEKEVRQSNLLRSLESEIRSIGWTFRLTGWKKIKAEDHALLLVVPGIPESAPEFALVQEIDINPEDGTLDTKVRAWKQELGQETQLLGMGSLLGETSEHTLVRMRVEWPFRAKTTLHSFLRHFIRVFATPEIAKSVTSMSMAVNDLVVVDSKVPSPYIFPATAQPPWPKITPVRFKSTEWTALAVGMSGEILIALQPFLPPPASVEGSRQSNLGSNST